MSKDSLIQELTEENERLKEVQVQYAKEVEMALKAQEYNLKRQYEEANQAQVDLLLDAQKEQSSLEQQLYEAKEMIMEMENSTVASSPLSHQRTSKSNLVSTEEIAAVEQLQFELNDRDQKLKLAQDAMEMHARQKQEIIDELSRELETTRKMVATLEGERATLETLVDKKADKIEEMIREKEQEGEDYIRAKNDLEQLQKRFTDEERVSKEQESQLLKMKLESEEIKGEISELERQLAVAESETFEARQRTTQLEQERNTDLTDIDKLKRNVEQMMEKVELAAVEIELGKKQTEAASSELIEYERMLEVYWTTANKKVRKQQEVAFAKLKK